MYEELIKRLKDYSAARKGEIAQLTEEAADAIEELEKKMLNWQATADDHWDAYHHWFDAYMRDVPEWIPVTERLPSAGQVLINLHYMDGFNEVSLGEHWNCPDIPEEDGWGGFGGNGVVTHWMPLPEPPKEDGE